MLIELLTIFANNIVPILLIALIGFIAGKFLILDTQTLGRLIFNIFSPSLVFYSLARTQVSALEFGQVALAIILYTIILTAAASLLIRLQKNDRVIEAGALLCALTANNGNYGLPLISLAFGAEVLARGVLVFVSMVLVTYTFGVFVASSGRKNTRDALMTIFRVPMVYAALGGLLVNQLGITLPTPINNSLSLLTGGTFPAMLLLLGLQLSQSRFVHLRPVGLSVALRMLLAPLIALGVVLLLNLQNEAAIAVIMQASMPVAVLTTIFAMEFELNREQISGAVMLSTLLSPVTLSLIILLLRQTLVTTGG